MQWQLLSDRLFLKADSKVWSAPTNRQLFRLDFSPATTGQLEVSQGDGLITFGKPIVITTEISPIVLDLPVPLIVPLSDRRIALKADRTLRLSLSVLDDEPIFDIGSSSNVVSRLNEIATQIESIYESLSNMNTNTQYSDTCIESTTESTTESITLLDANINRKFASIMNSSDAILYIDFQDIVSLENYAVRILPWRYYEMPSGIRTKVVGIWNKSTGSAFIREYS